MAKRKKRNLKKIFYNKLQYKDIRTYVCKALEMLLLI